MPAAKLDEIDRYFQNTPIGLDEFDQLYINADEGRGGAVLGRLQRKLLGDPDGNLKILFAGHRGCGKSTELVRLQKALSDEFVILNYSIEQDLDKQNIHYIELFIASMERLFAFLEQEPRVGIDERYLRNIQSWLTSREIVEVSQKYMGMDLDAGAKAGVTIPFLANFFAKFRASAKASTSLKEVLKTKVEPKLSEFLMNCNMFIDQVKKQLPSIDKKGLLIVIEDLDKLNPSVGEEIFYGHSGQLRQLECNCVFTFPIALLYNIKFKPIETNFDKVFILPMIKVARKKGGVFTKGIQTMEAIVAQRMVMDLFKSRTLLKNMIKNSGGVLWDLFEMIREAKESARDNNRDVITTTDYNAALTALKTSYERTLAENKEKGISVAQYFETLRDCALDEDKKPQMTDIMLDLMNNLTVLGYNADNWHDVHPVVRLILAERGLI